MYQHKTHIAVDLMKRSPCLVFPVDELQVDWGSRAEQAVGFGLDISSERRHTNVEPLNDLPKEQKTQECQSDCISHFVTHSLSVHCLSRSQRSLVSTAGYWYASSGVGRFQDIQSVREKCDLHTAMPQNVNLLWLNFFIFLLFVV